MNINKFVKLVLNEDLGRGDLFSHCFSQYKNEHIDSEAIVKTKEDGVFSGKNYIESLIKLTSLKVEFFKNDGEKFHKNDVLLKVKGNYLNILKIERSLLNMLAHSSGIATKTNKLVNIIDNLTLLDTRKTRPLLRIFEKYSTKNGGALNHRLGLDDCLMLKDTHLSKIENIKRFIEIARKNIPWTSKIEVEVNNISLAQECLESKIDIIMCDNMKLNDIKEVIRMKNEINPLILVEISGNVNEDNIKIYKDIQVDAISSGSIIHQATWIDLSMSIIK